MTGGLKRIEFSIDLFIGLPKEVVMTKEQIYKCTYDTLMESLEWGFDMKDDGYFNYVDGVLSMTSQILERVNDNNNGKSGDRKVEFSF
jgi:hypothetical protein